jgi:UDP-N-acetylglucosamine 2-epimerase (non-hydrolysing)
MVILDLPALEAHASLVLTDSGGVQEETTYLGTPCLTARPNTERPATITQGTNRLVASRPADLAAANVDRVAAQAARLNRGTRPVWTSGRRVTQSVGERRGSRFTAIVRQSPATIGRASG